MPLDEIRAMTEMRWYGESGAGTTCMFGRNSRRISPARQKGEVGMCLGDGFRSGRQYIPAALKNPPVSGASGRAATPTPRPRGGETASILGFARLCRTLEHIPAVFEE